MTSQPWVRRRRGTRIFGIELAKILAEYAATRPRPVVLAATKYGGLRWHYRVPGMSV
jgi:hypothetical protein